MALKDLPENLSEYLNLASVVRHSPNGRLWATYDEVGDVLYVHFNEPGQATDSEITEDDIIVRYEGDEIIGLTILHASQR